MNENIQQNKIENEQENNPIIVKCEEQPIGLVLKYENKYLTEKRRNKWGFLNSSKYIIIFTSINIAFTIIELATLITNSKNYNQIKENILNKPNSIISETYVEMWYNIGKSEKGILIPYIIFSIIFLIYIILMLLIFKKKIHFKIGVGLRYYILLIINLIFLALLIIFPLYILYLLIYSFFVVLRPPYNFNNKKDKGVAIFHNIILIIHFNLSWFLFYVYYYFLKLFIDNDDKAQNPYYIYEKIKSKKIWINNLHFNIKVKPYDLFLLETEFESDKPNFYQFADLKKPEIHNRYLVRQKCLKFKEIFIEDFSNEYIYINLQHISIEDQFPFTNDGYFYYSFLFYISLIVLISSIFPFKLHMTNEKSYILVLALDIFGGFEGLKKPRFYNIFKIYGNFEKKVNLSRFICYIISTIILFILLIIRSIYGGFRNIIFIKISFVINILIGLLNLVFLILSFLVFLFSIFFMVARIDLELYDLGIMIKNAFHIVLNVFFIIYFICGLILSFNNIFYFFDIIKARRKICNVNNIAGGDINPELIFDYADLNKNKKKLYEYKIQGLPKYLFYSHNEIKINYNPNEKDNEINNQNENINSERTNIEPNNDDS